MQRSLLGVSTAFKLWKVRACFLINEDNIVVLPTMCSSISNLGLFTLFCECKFRRWLPLSDWGGTGSCCCRNFGISDVSS